MQTKQSEQLQSPTNASENHNSTSTLVERKQIEGTPFTLIRKYVDHDPLLDDTRYIHFLVMGDHRLTEPTETEEETLQKIITEQWLIIANVIAIIVDKTIQIQENK